MKLVVLLFGECGTGKSNLGKKIAKLRDMTFVDGNMYLSPAALEKIRNFEFPSKSEIDIMAYDLMMGVNQLCSQATNGVVVSQSLYRNANRIQVIHFLEQAGYTVEVYWVKSDIIQHVKRLFGRRRGASWLAYWMPTGFSFRNLLITIRL